MRDRSVWLFNASSFSGNPKWLFVYINERRPDIEAHWITDDESTVTKIRRLGFSAHTFGGAKSVALQRRAGVYVVNQVKERIDKDLTGVVLLNLWHGVGVKKVERTMTDGFLLPRIATKYIRNNKAYRDTQMFLVTSPTMERHFREQIDFTEEQVIRAGYPQNVYRTVGGTFASFDHDLRRRKGLSADTRIALYAPTYRLSGNDDLIGRAIPDVDRLIEVLEAENMLLVLKMHPQIESERAYLAMKATYENHPRLLFWDASEDVYEVFDSIDTAIIDYSSIHYDLLAAGVQNFVRYIYDYGESAALEPGLDYLALSCGTVASSFEELLGALRSENQVPTEERARLLDEFWAYSDENAFSTIIERALAFETRDTPLPTLYSFDVFDTVIHRRVVVPEGVFFNVRQRMQLSDVAFPGDLQNHFVAVRKQSEAAVREYRRKSPIYAHSLEFEIQFDDIYERMRDLYALSDLQVDTLKEWELEAELETCIPDEARIEEISQLLAAGERVILISDMYLPQPFVEKMLAKVSPVLAQVPLFLSSSELVQKSTSALYVRVFTQLGYDFAEWVHTGDNRHADGTAARRLAITTRLVETPTFDDVERDLASTIPSYDGHLLAGMLRDARVGYELNDAELFAYRVAALYLVPYVDWVLEDARRRGYEQLYFISRDGHHMRKIAEALIEARDLPMSTDYIYGSRKAWRLASHADDIHDDIFSPYGSFGGVRTWQGLLDAARIDEDRLLAMLPELREYVGRSFNGYVAGQIVRSLDSSAEYRRHLQAVANEDRVLTASYLRDNIDLGTKFAFVEYWGRGYTQDCLARLLEFVAEEKVDVPFYYARSIYPSSSSSIRHNFTSAGYSLLLIESLFANLPYGSVSGYREGADGIEVVAAERDYYEELFLAFERVLPMFARDFAALPALDLDRLRRDAYRAGFDRFRRLPDSPDYVRFIAPLKDAVELGSDEREFAPALRVRDVVAYLRGKPISEITRSMPLTLARSRGLAPFLYKAQKKVGFRRVYKRLARQVRTVTASGVARVRDALRPKSETS